MAKLHVETTINGEPTEILVAPQQSLLETLRDGLMLTGAKEGCNDGNCGACTVIMDGRTVNSCLVLGAEAQDADITTIEGLATPTGLHPLQQAFLISSKSLLDSNPNPSEEEGRFWLAGNLCRCTGYDKIVRAVLDAAKEMKAGN